LRNEHRADSCGKCYVLQGSHQFHGIRINKDSLQRFILSRIEHSWNVIICCSWAAVFYSTASDFEQTPSHRNGDSMSSVVRLQFVHKVFDVEIDRRLSNCELIGDLLISMAVSDEPKHLQFPVGEIVFAQVLREARCNFGRQISST
jgi:hypothetical protein